MNTGTHAKRLRMTADTSEAARRECDLCGLPATGEPFRQSIGGTEHAFCCAGCLNVYTILYESGVIAADGDFRQSELYRRSQELGLISNPVEKRSAIPEDAETRETVYHLSGMWCTSCGWLIEHSLRRERGVVVAEVNFTSDLLKVRYAPQFVAPERIGERIASLGYRAAEYTGDRDADRANWHDLLLRLGIAGALWMNIMLFSLVVYASYFEGIADWARRGIPFILMVLATPAVFYSAWPIHRIAWFGLREGVIRMEALISAGVFAAYFYSVIQAFLGGQHYYFDTAGAIVTFVLTGKALERGAKEKSARAVALLHRLMPTKARISQAGAERFVAADAVTQGMTLLVKPGERIPADGVVIEGSSWVDESVLTGESKRLSRGTGQEVMSGSLNGGGVLTVRVNRPASESTLAQIIRSVDETMATRTHLERTVDQVSRVFVPTVLLIAGLTLAGSLVAGLSSTEAMLRAIAVMVIACPCALGIATPLATNAAIGAASRRGILIREARVLETIREVDVVVFDKTGTVTVGDFGIRESLFSPVLAGVGAEDADPLSLAAALEAGSEHPLAAAILRLAEESGKSLRRGSDVEIFEGAGISGRVEGRRVVVGNRRLLEAKSIPLERSFDEVARRWEDSGLTTSFVAIDREVAGALAFGDRIRPEAAAVVEDLRRKGIHTVLLSGDTVAATAHIAKALGVDEFRGEVAPGEKAQAIRALQSGNTTVAMVGDGINDGPALAAADLGIAMGSGTDLAMHAAPVVLTSDSLARIADTFEIAIFALKVVRQNLFWAFAYNLIGITLAITGILNPILAAGAMVLSSLSVIGNSLRLSRRYR